MLLANASASDNLLCIARCDSRDKVTILVGFSSSSLSIFRRYRRQKVALIFLLMEHTYCCINLFSDQHIMNPWLLAACPGPQLPRIAPPGIFVSSSIPTPATSFYLTILLFGRKWNFVNNNTSEWHTKSAVAVVSIAADWDICFYL